MNLKSILSVCALAIVAVNADKRTESSKACNKRNGIFLEARDDPSDTRYACLAPPQEGDEKTKYCVTYDGWHICYQPDLGNINYCDYNSSEYHSRGCALGLGYLYNEVKDDDKKHNSSLNTCYQKGGIFLDNNHDVSDTRFACLLPRRYGDEKTKYTVNYDGRSLTYAPELGNISYCVLDNKNYHSRGCALGLGYLYNMYRDEQEKRDKSRKTCPQKGGIYLENYEEPTDRRFACLLPKRYGDEKTKYCVTYDNKNLCYAPDLGNIDYCEYNNENYHGRGCAMGLSYLYGLRRY